MTQSLTHHLFSDTGSIRGRDTKTIMPAESIFEACVICKETPHTRPPNPELDSIIAEYPEYADNVCRYCSVVMGKGTIREDMHRLAAGVR